MPSGPRLRSNNSYGLTTNAPLTAGATTFNSAGLVTLPTVAAAHAIVTLDPLREHGEPEIVVVTAHTAAATVATITRAQYGTVARSHPVNTTWVHAPLDEDFVEVLTSSTLPANPYAGQEVFETDLDKYVARNAANTAWVDKVPLGAWAIWTPTLTNLTLGAGTVIAKFTKFGRTILWRFRFTLGAGSAVGSNPFISAPTPAEASYGTLVDPIGRVSLQDTGTANWVGETSISGSTIALFYLAATDNLGTITATAPFTWASGDFLGASGCYEAAA